MSSQERNFATSGTEGPAESDVADDDAGAPETARIHEIEGTIDPTADEPITGEDDEPGLTFPGPGA